MYKFITFSLLLSISLPSAAELKTVSLSIPKMTCPACPFIIQRSLLNVAGVSDVTTNFAAKTATVTFDDSKSNLAQLTKTTKNAGYPAVLIAQ